MTIIQMPSRFLGESRARYGTRVFVEAVSEYWAGDEARAAQLLAAAFPYFGRPRPAFVMLRRKA